MAIEGKPNKLQLTSDGGNDQEGEAVPVALFDVDGNRIETAGSSDETSIIDITDITQTGTDDPTFTELRNDTDATVSMTRLGAGQYQVDFSENVLTENKTMFLSNNGAVATSSMVHFIRAGDNLAYILSWTGANTASDNTLSSASWRIIIYP